MFIIEIIIYVTFAWVMYYFVKLSYFKHPQNSRLDLYLFCAIFFWALVSGIRWGVGSDYFPYAWQFDQGMLENNLENRSHEVIWIWFVSLFNRLNIHYTVGMGIVAFMQMYFIFISLKSQKYLLLVLPIILFAGWFNFILWGGMRQMLVACVFVYISKWIIERKMWQYFLTLFLLHYIHNSALILLPLYFFPRTLQLSDKRILCLVVFFMCFIIGLTPKFQYLISSLSNIAQIAGYTDYVEEISTKLSGDSEAETRAFGPTMLSYFLICCSTIIYSPKLKSRYGNIIPNFELWYIFAYIYSCGFFLFSNTSHIFLRPISYFSLFLMLILSMLLFYFRENIKENRIHYFLLKFILWMGIIWTIFKLSKIDSYNYITYKFFWNHSLYEILINN